jgi:hypothetical protein
MSKEEMNKFLESIGGLENGFYTDRPPIINCNFFSVDDGWLDLIKDLIEDLIKLGWDKQVCQVKENFGGLRFYINSGSDDIYKRITEAENLSYKTCEATGKPGKLRNDIGWVRTLCDEEYQKVRNAKGLF